MPTTLETPAVTAIASCDCLPEYQLLDCLGRTPLAEVWKAQGPDGRLWAVKYIYAAARHGSLNAQQLKVAQWLPEMVHPGLAKVAAIANDQGRLVIVTELAELTLRDRFDECWSQGQTGIPRAELLRHVKTAAEALDYLRDEHSFQHLSLNPRNLLVKNGQLVVSDFGLVQLLWMSSGHSVSNINPRYAAPELFEGRLSASSDQYSLALIYQEMLTGHLPHRGQSNRQLAEARRRGQGNLDALPAHDRDAVHRALHPDPRDRFDSCSDFVRNLTADATNALLVHPGANFGLNDGVRIDVPALPSGLTPEQLVAKLVHSVAAAVTVQSFGRVRYHFTKDGTWEHKCAAWLAEGVGRQKLRGFLTRWNAELVHFDDVSLVFRLDLGTNIWQRLVGNRQNVLEVLIRLDRARAAASQLTEATVRMRFLRGDSPSGRNLLSQVGPAIADELHVCLMATPERRIQERFAFDRPLSVSSAYGQAGAAKRLECVGKDISYTGIGFYTPQQPPSAEVYIYQPSSPELAPFAIPAAVTRVQRSSEGWYEAGARFLVQPPHKA